jgi:hypothetical protein
MPKPLPTDGVQLNDGDTVILLCGSYSPAHIGYFRALEALAKRKATEIWIAPLYALLTDGVQDMCTMLATEASVATKRQIGCCLAGLSKGFLNVEELIPWCHSRYPGLKFLTAKLHGYGCGKTDIEIRFSGQEIPPARGPYLGKEAIFLSQYLPVPDNLVERIQSGMDESRNFLAPVWEYVQKRKLYRNFNGKI